MTRYSVVCDLSFGDSGKGRFVDYLCRNDPKANWVVRYNGGAQAGHNVITPSGRHHCFHQLGSGTLVNTHFDRSVRTFMTKDFLLDLYALESEQALLQKNFHLSLDVLTPRVAPHVRLVTPFHKAANKIREWARTASDEGGHGTCGFGVGELMMDTLEHPDDVIYAFELKDRALCESKLQRIQKRKAEELKEQIEMARNAGVLSAPLDHLTNAANIDHVVKFFCDKDHNILVQNKNYLHFHDDTHVVLEGAQGVLLDQDFGFHPYTTWSKTTPENADNFIKLCQDNSLSASDYEVHHYGLIRSYTTRHGAGPMPTYNDDDPYVLGDPYNPYNAWQGEMRFGPLDVPLLGYALRVCGNIDSLVVSHMDQLPYINAICMGYELAPAYPYLFKYTTPISDDPQKQLERQQEVTDFLNSVQDLQCQVMSPNEFKNTIQDTLLYIYGCNIPISHMFDGPTALHVMEELYVSKNFTSVSDF